MTKQMVMISLVPKFNVMCNEILNCSSFFQKDTL